MSSSHLTKSTLSHYPYKLPELAAMFVLCALVNTEIMELQIKTSL